tara:strand:+ start:7582 stop:8421 length:840 start_codon:yes stop_codon:yes gene_type:complete
MSQWQAEWNKFSADAIRDMKKYSDKTHEEREWMCYVYERDGQYFLGNVTYGDESRIEVNPQAKAHEDALTEGLTNRKWTIHGHPLKDGKIYTGRQYFSSTDIVDEFIKCRDNNEYIVQYVVYPHQQLDTNTGKRVLHNRVRVLVFPDSDTVVRAMQQASPGCDPYSINRESGQNKNVPDGSGGSTLANDAGADWFAFQEVLGKMGYMGIVDLEGPAMGAEEYNSEGIVPTGLVNVVGVLAVGAVLLGVFRYNKQIKNAKFGVETVEGNPEPEGFHFWKD